MKRRRFVAGALALPLVGFARPETLPQRKAVFEEVGNSVLLSLDLPNLVRKNDKGALKNIDSSFDTTLEYTIKVHQIGTRRVVATVRVTVKLRRDPWKKRYVVSTGTLGGWSKRVFQTRDRAIAAAVKLDRVRVCAASELERGEEGPYYFVSVLALRNPIKVRRARRRGASGRGRGRDLEWFGRLVEVLAGERAKAEVKINVRTNAFFLMPR